jgi:hypothetical protein
MKAVAGAAALPREKSDSGKRTMREVKLRLITKL